MYKYHIIIMHTAPWRLLLLSIGNIIYLHTMRATVAAGSRPIYYYEYESN